jgi:AcrR family transcriptional regulator
MTTKWQRKVTTRNVTADRLLRAGRRLLRAEGAEAVSMRRVAGAVGITAMAIYRHFPDRDSLLKELADEGFRELAARLRNKKYARGFGERLLEMGDVYLEHALESPRLFELMFLRARRGARRFPQDFKAGKSPTANVMIEAVQDGMRRGYFRKGDAWEVVFEMGALSHGLILLYLGGRLTVSKERFREMYRAAFGRYLRGIRK